MLSGDWSVDSYLGNILLNTLCFRPVLGTGTYESKHNPAPKSLILSR